MEFKEQSVPTGILLKIRKLQALAERGVGGEATNAKILLSALCEKYGIDESKLDEEEKQWYEFEMRTSVQKLFLQAAAIIFIANISSIVRSLSFFFDRWASYSSQVSEGYILNLS